MLFNFQVSYTVAVFNCLYFSNLSQLLWISCFCTWNSKFLSDLLFNSCLLSSLLIYSSILRFYIPSRSSIVCFSPTYPNYCEASDFVHSVVSSRLTYLIPVSWLGCWFVPSFPDFAVLNYMLTLLNVQSRPSITCTCQTYHNYSSVVATYNNKRRERGYLAF